MSSVSLGRRAASAKRPSVCRFEITKSVVLREAMESSGTNFAFERSPRECARALLGQAGAPHWPRDRPIRVDRHLLFQLDWREEAVELLFRCRNPWRWWPRARGGQRQMFGAAFRRVAQDLRESRPETRTTECNQEFSSKQSEYDMPIKLLDCVHVSLRKIPARLSQENNCPPSNIYCGLQLCSNFRSSGFLPS